MLHHLFTCRYCFHWKVNVVLKLNFVRTADYKSNWLTESFSGAYNTLIDVSDKFS